MIWSFYLPAAWLPGRGKSNLGRCVVTVNRTDDIEQRDETLEWKCFSFLTHYATWGRLLINARLAATGGNSSDK